jgi:hypothetical protein
MFVLHKHRVRAIIRAREGSIAYQKQNGVLLRAVEALVSCMFNVQIILWRTLAALSAREAVRAPKDMVVRGSWGKVSRGKRPFSTLLPANFTGE